MARVLYLVAVLAAGTSLRAEASGSLPGPTYSADSIVNAASNVVGALAPNTFATIYGENLSYEPAWAPANVLRTDLAGVRVTVGAVSAVLYYVSPGQINLLIPSSRVLGGAGGGTVRGRGQQDRSNHQDPSPGSRAGAVPVEC